MAAGTNDATYATGISFTFASATYTATQISVNRSVNEIDCTSTDIATGGFRRLRGGEVENCEIKVDWIGLTVPPVNATGAFTLSNGFGHTGSSALCTGLSITATAGDLIKGSATFKVSYD
jgi:hypothetical protein